MKIALLGDIALFGHNSISVCPDLCGRYSQIRSILKEFDCVIGNLETPLTSATRCHGGKSAYIKASLEDVEILKYLGVTHVSLANNHMFDYNNQGASDTMKALDNAGIAWFGLNGASRYLEMDDCKVAFHGYCCWSTNPCSVLKGNRRFGVNPLDPCIMEKDLVNDEEEGYLSILSCHWGQEHVHYPNSDHISLARSLAKDHSFILHGHHPHVLQGFETVDDSLILYSLGNFCFDDVYSRSSRKPLIEMSNANRQSCICSISVCNNKITNYQLIPIINNKDGVFLDYDDSTLEDLSKWSEALRHVDDEYERKRSEIIASYIASRKKKRTFSWYLRRLRFDSVKMIAAAKKNKKCYKADIEDYCARVNSKNGKK